MPVNRSLTDLRTFPLGDRVAVTADLGEQLDVSAGDGSGTASGLAHVDGHAYILASDGSQNLPQRPSERRGRVVQSETTTTEAAVPVTGTFVPTPGTRSGRSIGVTTRTTTVLAVVSTE
jgi:hypothetical protein